MLRSAVVILFLTIGILLGGGMALAEKRSALVIGNADYPTSRLANPVNDAKDVAARLRELGFTVDLVTDANLDAFEASLDRFYAAASGSDAILIYFAGHSFQFEGQNWLMPIDTNVEAPARARRTNISLQQIFRDVEGRAKTTLVFLDACRTNPLADRLHATQGAEGRAFGTARGLARVEVSSTETLLVYATRPNTVAEDGYGRNSPFTKAFLDQLASPQTEVEAMMKRVTAEVEKATNGKQIPERLSALRREFYFAAPPSSSVAGEGAPIPARPQLSPSAPAVASAPSASVSMLVMESKDWKVVTSKSATGKVCFAMTRPTRMEPTSMKHGDVFFFMSNRQEGEQNSAPSLQFGYPLKEGSPVVVDIDGRKFYFFTKGDGAWLERSIEDIQFLNFLKKGKTMSAAGVSARGNRTSYAFSLAGVSGAIDGATKECR